MGLFKKYVSTSSHCPISCHVPIIWFLCLMPPFWPLADSNNFLSFTLRRMNALKPFFFFVTKSLHARLHYNVPFMWSKTDFSRRGMWPPRMVSMWVSNLPSRAAPGLDIPGCITPPAWQNDLFTYNCSIPECALFLYIQFSLFADKIKGFWPIWSIPFNPCL